MKGRVAACAAGLVLALLAASFVVPVNCQETDSGAESETAAEGATETEISSEGKIVIGSEDDEPSDSGSSRTDAPDTPETSPGADASTEEPIDASTDASTEESTDASTDASTDKSSEESSADGAAEDTAEDAAEAGETNTETTKEDEPEDKDSEATPDGNQADPPAGSTTEDGDGEGRSEDDLPPDDSAPQTDASTTQESEDNEELPTCSGTAKFLCCDDEDFVTEGDKTFCGCWGDGVEQGCSFEVQKDQSPVLVTELPVTPETRPCRCQKPEVFERECFGRTKLSCCDNIKPGQTKCHCLFGTRRCLYEKVDEGKWRNTMFGIGDCTCP